VGQWWITLLGTAAGLCTVGSFVPQVVKAWREGDTNAISLRMYLVLVAGFVLWLGYGLLIGSWPIILVNAANLALSAAILWLKLRDGKGAGLGRVAAIVGSTEARPGTAAEGAGRGRPAAEPQGPRRSAQGRIREGRKLNRQHGPSRSRRRGSV
jgi:MtN3 and saliva related transmembrane protein